MLMIVECLAMHLKNNDLCISLSYLDIAHAFLLDEWMHQLINHGLCSFSVFFADSLAKKYHFFVECLFKIYFIQTKIQAIATSND